ncbi:hypothetical protein PG997_010115 [Apiospora hydei]|uniref:Uncharacterized protein n=1 Tax=Apiospora hydei TaxID=1337664 RepID=A0ABR1VW48_9PEZI
MFETMKSCCMIQRGFALHGTRRCRTETCQEEFVKDPSNCAHTPWGFSDLEWQAEDLRDLKGITYDPKLDAARSG